VFYISRWERAFHVFDPDHRQNHRFMSSPVHRQHERSRLSPKVVFAFRRLGLRWDRRRATMTVGS